MKNHTDDEELLYLKMRVDELDQETALITTILSAQKKLIEKLEARVEYLEFGTR